MSDYGLQAEEEMWTAIASQSPPAVFQVFAVYPSGNEYPVRGPHVSRAAASDHVKRCSAGLDSRDTFHYYYREVSA